MSSFANISIRFNADLKQFSSQIQNANRSMQKMGKRMTSVGKNLSVGLTAPIVAFGYKSVEAFDMQVKAETALRTALKGNAKAFETLTKQASEFQKISLFGDEQIIKQQAFLSTMNLTEDQIGNVIQAAMNLSAATDMSLESAVKNLSKTFGGLTGELGESIPALRNLTKEQLIAGEAVAYVNEAFEGQAEAASRVGLGPLKQLQNSIGDLGESFGSIISEYINPFVSKLQSLIDHFNGLDQSTKRIIVVIGALAAAIGPVLLALGFLMTTVIPGLITAFGALTLPITAVVAAIAAIGYVVYKNWDYIKKQMVALQNYFIDLYNESRIFRSGVEQIIFAFKTLWNVVKLVFGSIWTVIKDTGKYIVDTFSNVGAAVKAVLTGDLGALPGIMSQQMSLMSKSFGKSLGAINKDIERFTDTMKSDFSTALENSISRKKIAFVKENIDASAITEKVAEAVTTGMAGGGTGSGGRAKVSAVSTFQAQAPIQTSPFDIIAPRMADQVESMNEMQLKHLSNAMAFNEGLTAIMSDTAAGFAEGFGQMIGSLSNGGNFMQSLFQLIVSTVGDMAIRLGKMAIGIGFAVEGIKKALQSLSGPVAIAAGVALVALGTVAKNALGNMAKGGGGGSIPAFANGGLVYGPTLGLMGEYSGARSNPEVIAPLDKLKGMITDTVGGGGGSAKGEFTLRGQDLILALNRAGAYKDRRG